MLNVKKDRPITIELRDGRRLVGHLRLDRRTTAASLLGGDGSFLTIKTSQGEIALHRDMIAALTLGDEGERTAPLGKRAKARPGTETATAAKTLSSYDPCRILGVTPGSSAQTIKAAWRKRMAQCHPDKVRGRGYRDDIIAAAQREAQTVNAAYHALMALRQTA